MRNDVDVVVVGAGLSGLVAARELRRDGAAILVLEAADRCGGRAMSETSALGSRLDLGGQWIGKGHDRLAALVDELGATRFEMHTGSMPRVVDGSRPVSLLSPSMLLAVGSLLALDANRRVRLPDAWRTTSVAEWLRWVPGGARRLLEVTALISWTADLDRVSVFTMMSMIRNQGGLVKMLSTKGGAQDSLIVEGVGFLVDRIAAELGDAVHTNAAVTAVVRDERGVVVRTAGDEVRARRVIVAVPPPMAARITHEPELPPARRELERDTFMGSVYKAIAVYREPFWRKSSSAELVFLDRPGCAVFDSSAPGGPGHLCLLIGGPEARTLDALDPDARRTMLLARIAAHLGPDVMTPASWHEKAWHLDPHAGGGYTAMPVVGASPGTLPMSAEPIGRLHWAGSETAAEHPGYLDGAIEAGKRAAREVAEALAAERDRPV